MNLKRSHITLFLALLLLASCREPLSREVFLSGEGPFVFTVDLTDSTAVYDLDLFTRVDAREVPASLELFMRWRSPSDSLFRETVYLPLEGHQGPFSRDVYQPYRTDIRPTEPGLWMLSVAVPSVPEGFLGLGLVVRKNH